MHYPNVNSAPENGRVKLTLKARLIYRENCSKLVGFKEQNKNVFFTPPSLKRFLPKYRI
jgi:hypothetical protein